MDNDNANSANAKVIVRKGARNIPLDQKWAIVEMYLEKKRSLDDIADIVGISRSTVEGTINDVYKRFQNVKETNALIATQGRPKEFFHLMKTSINPDRINQEFLEKLSEPDSLVLSDAEVIFAELFINLGDGFKALEESGLAIGLNKNPISSYKDALKLRSLYLRRKANVASYIKELQKQNLEILKEGKEHIQMELFSLLEKLRNNDDPRLVNSYLKSIEMLGKSLGAFEEKHVIETVGGDDHLNSILHRAKQAQVMDI